MADRKQGAGLSSGSSASVHKVNCQQSLLQSLVSHDPSEIMKMIPREAAH